MEDWMLDPEAFAEANRGSRLDHLRSLTLLSAAEEMERILNLGPEFWKAAVESRIPMLPNRAPEASLAILLGSDPLPE